MESNETFRHARIFCQPEQNECAVKMAPRSGFKVNKYFTVMTDRPCMINGHKLITYLCVKRERHDNSISIYQVNTLQ